MAKKVQMVVRDIFPRRSEEDVTEDMTEPVGRFPMSVFFVHATHTTEVSHQMLQCAAVMRRQSIDQTTQRRLTLLCGLDFFTPSVLSKFQSRSQCAFI